MYRWKQLIVAIGLPLFWICACSGTLNQVNHPPAPSAAADPSPAPTAKDSSPAHPSTAVQALSEEPIPAAAPNTSEASFTYGKDRRKMVVKTDRPMVANDQLARLSSAGGFNAPEPVVFSRLATAKPSPKGTVPADSSELVVLNFDDAELYEVIRTIAEILKLDYMVDAAVQGKVTIHTSDGLSKEQLFPIFNQILSANNLVLILENGLYYVRPAKEMSRLALSQATGRRLPELRQGENQIIQIIPLRHITATEMTKIIQPFLSANSSVVSHDDSNALIVVDTLAVVEKVLRLVDVFDIDIFSKVGHRIYPLLYANAADTATIVDSIFKAYGRTSYIDYAIIPIESINALLVVSSDRTLFERVTALIEDLDITTEAIQPRIYVYSVKNGNAVNLAQILSSVFSKKDEAEQQKSTEAKQTAPDAPAPVDIFAKTKAPKPKKPEIVSHETTATESGFSGTLKGNLKITSDEIRNALIIEAVPSDYQIVEGILRKIDVMPRQVLIEVLVAEITLDESTELGIEWQAFKALSNPSTSLLSATAGAGGLAYTIGQVGEWTNILSALATESKVNVLASPSVLASDNTAANINISDEIPTASQNLQSTTGTDQVVATTIQYRNTGIILNVTPHINERGLVSMEVEQEISKVGSAVTIAGQSYPSFRKRTVNTSLTVNDAQTIVIGGLMQETLDKGDEGIPFFSKIPIIGWLVGHKSKTTSKTELIIMITPRVIVNSDDIDHVSREFKTKVNTIFKH